MKTALPGTETHIARFELATRLNLGTVPVGHSNRSSSAFRLLAACTQAACMLSFVASILVTNPNPGVPSRDQRDSLPSLRNCSPLSRFIWANFGRNYSLSTAPPTKCGMSALPRESAEESPRFPYAIILTYGALPAVRYLKDDMICSIHGETRTSDMKVGDRNAFSLSRIPSSM